MANIITLTPPATPGAFDPNKGLNEQQLALVASPLEANYASSVSSLSNESMSDTESTRSTTGYINESLFFTPESLKTSLTRTKSKEADSGVEAWESPNQPDVALFQTKTYMEYAFDYQWAINQYPAAWSIFVGNLPANFTNEQLTQMVHEVFRRYGRCYGYVHRDFDYRKNKERPWAVLQFTNPEDALNAHTQSLAPHPTGHLISTRPIRVEYSRVKRDVYIHGALNNIKSNSNSLSPRGRSERFAHNLLSRFGPFEMVFRPTREWCQRFGVPMGGVYVRFLRYGSFLGARGEVGGWDGVSCFCWGLCN